MALAVTASFVCSEPEDGLAPDSLASGCAGFLADFEVELSDFLTRSLQPLAVSLLKLSCQISSQDPSSH